jgi:hypothetical protein
MNVLVRKAIGFINEEIIKKNQNSEIFTYSNASKAYNKSLKIFFILLIYFKFILIDFNYDGSLRTNVKKMLNSINDVLINLTDNLILSFIVNSNGSNGLIQSDIYREFLEKYQKVVKLHKIKKNMKELLNNVLKNSENAINIIKQFSKLVFFLMFNFYFKHSKKFEFYFNKINLAIILKSDISNPFTLRELIYLDP